MTFVNATKRSLFCGVALACAASFEPAFAQQALRGQPANTGYSNFQRDRNISVRQRPHPGYEALGLREGAFMVWPKLNTTVEYNSNVFAQDSNAQSDTVWHIAPELDISSNWSRHELDAWARATINRYSDFSSENTNDVEVGTQGRLDVMRNAQINAGADYIRATEPRTAPTSQGLAHPTQYDLTTAYLSGAREFNRLRLSGRLDAQNFIYLNRSGNPQQHDRDHALYIATERADYAISPDTAWFVQVSENKRDYRLAATPGVLVTYPFFENRDSKGVQVLTGANFEISALMRGEIGIGYMKQDYDNPRFNKISGLGANAQLEWFPTQLTTVTFTGSRTIEDAGILGASGYLSTNVGAQVDHELLRNVVLSANASYGNDDYRGADRKDKRYAAGVSATYLFNRAVGVTVGYNHFKQDSSGANGSGNFNVDKVGATLTLQY
ncbi:outer membrane beta-barrel protein [Phenylobacterium soli]|uniref:Outer membrane beta-barrel protein n=1 Tax=Phenylobacterium soli TaxID=2170551 RepID=A0A328AM87_9CAUL|nr:outer membrane beta-barrel protein [Phenylobacterium soli]RAK56083.1 hypothetical protein DJ017_16975 [Phenylobacterium soli]